MALRGRIGLALLFLAGAAAAQPQRWQGSLGPSELRRDASGDFKYQVIEGYLDITIGDLRIRADRAVLVYDSDELLAGERAAAAPDDLPRRDVVPPLRQEDLRVQTMRARLGGRLAAIGFPVPPGKDRLALLVRAVYAEGHVFVDHAGLRQVRCSKFFLSLVSDRGVMEDVWLTMPLGTKRKPGNGVFVLRSPRVIQQGRRLIARDARLTTCEAGEPHFEFDSERLTITELDNRVFELHGEGNRVVIGALPALPVPDYRHFTDQESWLPLRGVFAGSSTDRGAFALAEFGAGWNRLGQTIVDLFASAPERFRGEWWLRTGWTRKRGSPVEGGLGYELPGSFKGEIESFFLQDHGTDRRSVTRNLDGSAIAERDRTFTRTRNRIDVTDDTRLDIEAFTASDPAVYTEFRPSALKSDEVPETIVHLRHAAANRRLSVIGRMNAVGFSYDSTARLAESFRSERPYVRGDLFAQPIADLLEDWPLVLDVSFGAGRLRNQFDDTSTKARREASWRGDLALELSAPRSIEPFAVQPYVGVRETWYSDRPGDTNGTWRKALEAGALVATRLSRVFDVDVPGLGIDGLRHEMRPEVRGYHRFRVDRSPSDFFQFDDVDALDEGSVVDFTLLNRLQTRDREAGRSAPRDLVWLDLTQRVFPNSARDNAGERLGLLFFELIVKPGDAWLPVPNLRFLFEGERDWNRRDYKTRNVGIAAGPRELQVGVEWRSGRDGDGQGSVWASTQLFGRWELGAGVIWDFTRNQVNSSGLTLTRHDHDWSWILAFSKDENTNDTSFVFRFVPSLGNLFHPAPQRYIGGDPAFGVRNTGNF